MKIDTSKRVFLIKNDDFLINQTKEALQAYDCDPKFIYTKEDKESLDHFIETLSQTPLFGKLTAGFAKYPEAEFNPDTIDSIVAKVPKHAILIFTLDKLPGRLTAAVNSKIFKHDVFNEEECAEILNNILVVLGKKISQTARKFMLDKMAEDAQKALNNLTRTASYINTYYIEEELLKASFSETIAAFEGPMAFWKSKGLEASRILARLDYAAFRTLFPRFIINLIRFKAAEGESMGAKMQIVKGSPEVIRRFEDLVKRETPQSLENKYLYVCAALKLTQEEFLIKWLTYKP